MKNTYSFILSILLFSCAGNSETAKTISDTSSLNATDTTVSDESLTEENYLLENKTHHKFSDTDFEDEFSIVVTGESILNGHVVFTITNVTLGEIYRDEFATDYLIGWGLDGIQHPTEKQQEDFIQRRVNEFFAESQFTDPAIDANAEFGEEFIEEKVWKDIQSDRDAVGFFYLTGKENGQHIAYSRKLKKVVVYSSCC